MLLIFDIEVIGAVVDGALGVVLLGLEAVIVGIDGFDDIDVVTAVLCEVLLGLDAAVAKVDWDEVNNVTPALIVGDVGGTLAVLCKLLPGLEAGIVEAVLCELPLRMKVGEVETGSVEAGDEAVA